MRTLIACVAVSLLAAEDGKLHRAGEQARQPRPAPAPGRPSAPAPNPGHAPATDDCATDLGDQLAGQTVGLLFEGSYLLTYGMFGSGDEHWRGS